MTTQMRSYVIRSQVAPAGKKFDRAGALGRRGRAGSPGPSFAGPLDMRWFARFSPYRPRLGARKLKDPDIAANSATVRRGLGRLQRRVQLVAATL
jgi:hypothetical protein